MTSQEEVTILYKLVIEDVINKVQDIFDEEAVNEQILQDLKLIWESKLNASKYSIPKYEYDSTDEEIEEKEMKPDCYVPIKIMLPSTLDKDPGIRSLEIFIPEIKMKNLELKSLFPDDIITVAAGLTTPTAASFLQNYVNKILEDNETNANPSNVQSNIIIKQQYPIVLTLSIPEKNFNKNPPQLLFPRNPDSLLREDVLLEIHRRKQLRDQLIKKTESQEDKKTDDYKITASTSNITIKKEKKEISSSEEETTEDEESDAKSSEEDNCKNTDEPLNSDDDVTDEEPSTMFDTDNLILCQYVKIIRCRNKWKLYFKDGIMNLNGADYVFEKAIGDAPW